MYIGYINILLWHSHMSYIRVYKGVKGIPLMMPPLFRCNLTKFRQMGCVCAMHLAARTVSQPGHRLAPSPSTLRSPPTSSTRPLTDYTLIIANSNNISANFLSKFVYVAEGDIGKAASFHDERSIGPSGMHSTSLSSQGCSVLPPNPTNCSSSEASASKRVLRLCRVCN